ncbi:hypothetical protein VNO77_00727 [Canavalia gladiata]|uniref:Uncharacterized protein n=1 Tax=Canavalia gladiata TaxID=3824 RepID=A0AAN9R9K7_CANGL
MSWDASCHKYRNNVYARCITVRKQKRYVEFVFYLFFPGCMITDVVLSLDHAHDLGEVYDADADAHDLGNDAKTPYADGGSYVIDHVVEKYEMKEADVNGKRTKLIDFVIEDLQSNRLECILWGVYADQIEQFFNMSTTPHSVIII